MDFDFPPSLPSLDSVPLDLRLCYLADGDRFVLRPEVRHALNENDRQHGEATADRAKAIADKGAELARKEKLIERLQIDSALRAGMAAIGIPAKHQKAAIALYREEFQPRLRVDAAGAVTVATDYGDVSLPFSLNAWLNSDDAAPFVERKEQPGELAALLTGATRH